MYGVSIGLQPQSSAKLIAKIKKGLSVRAFEIFAYSFFYAQHLGYLCNLLTGILIGILLFRHSTTSYNFLDKVIG